MLSCSWLDRIHSPTSSIHADTRLWSCAVSHGRQDPIICVSLAQKCGCNPCVSTRPHRSAVYSRKRIGPKIDPSGTPNRTAFGSDDVDPQQTNCARRLRYETNHLCSVLLTPYDTSRRCRSVVWSTVSQAADRSSNVNIVNVNCCLQKFFHACPHKMSHFRYRQGPPCFEVSAGGCDLCAATGGDGYKQGC